MDFPHRRFPCDECPIRADNKDNPKSMFPAERWEALGVAVRDEETGEHPGMTDPMFGCHKGEPGTNADLACAGWLVQFGLDHVLVRLAAATGGLPPEALEAGANWPPLHETWAEVVRHQTADPQENRFQSYRTVYSEGFPPSMDLLEPQRCHALARRGTGVGLCDRTLDGQGSCDRASNHIDEP